MRYDQKLLIFIPTYNEAENVEALFYRLRDAIPSAHILFVDDNSPDGTGAIIDRIAAENSNVFAIHRSGKEGIGSAHLVGINWAYEHEYQRLVTMDCDFTHSPEEIASFLAEADGCEIVVGSRYLLKGSLRTWNAFRRCLTRTGHLLTTTLLKMPYDATGAFRLYRLDRIPKGSFQLVCSRSYSFFFESLFVLWLNGCRIREIPIDLPARTYGSSKMAIRDAVRSVVLLCYLCLKLRLDRTSLLYAEPFLSSAELTPTPAKTEWDAYWIAKTQTDKMIYDLIAAFYRKVIIRRMLNHFAQKHFVPQAEILHAGCGSGQVDTDIADRLEISALDISEQALSIYRKCQPHARQLIHGSIFEIPAADCSYDGVYNLGVMEHFTEQEIRRILLEFNRVLNAGGKLMLFWPPSFGLTVRVLGFIHWFLRKIGKTAVKLHPDEITHVRSKRQIQKYLEASGFSLLEFYFGPRDLFTQAVIVAQKRANASQATVSAADPGMVRFPVGFEASGKSSI